MFLIKIEYFLKIKILMLIQILKEANLSVLQNYHIKNIIYEDKAIYELFYTQNKSINFYIND